MLKRVRAASERTLWKEKGWRKASRRFEVVVEVPGDASSPGRYDRVESSQVEGWSKRARGGRHSSEQITSLVKSTLARVV